MAKARTVYCCQQCGCQTSRWAGKCADCGAWNSLQAEVQEKRSSAMGMALTLEGAAPVPMERVDVESEPRFTTGLDELDRVLGGGVVPGSLILLGGPPGIGKSTLLLQICEQLRRSRPPILYVSGEESARQIRLRADRLGVDGQGVLLLAETRLEAIEAQIEATKPGLVIIDSIQTLFKSDLSPAPGSVTQVRECAASLMRLAKTRNVPIFLVGHVTKQGELAGPRVLEHLVDTVLYFEGEGQHNVRALRSVKNRFGASHEVGLFEMGHLGLQPIHDASQFFLRQRAEGAAGTVIFPSMEGSRPVLVEIQALVNSSSRSENVPPTRRAVGLDGNRLSLLLAVVSRRLSGLKIGQADVYANCAGGLRLTEPALDLALVLAVASSREDTSVGPGLAACGEVGLTGEIRAVSQLEPRLKELSKMGFRRVLVPPHPPDVKGLGALKVVPVATIQEAAREAGLALRPRSNKAETVAAGVIDF